jgi:alkylation response protein AidB-like acyl-CoA dehydrogenase
MAAIGWSEEKAAQRKMDIMDEFAMEASMTKVWGSEALFYTADDAVQCFGGYGFSAEYPPERIYRDNRINRIFEGTNEINRLIAAGALFKRIGNGTIPAPKNTVDVPKTADFSGPLANLKAAVELSKRQASYASATGIELVGQKLIENQEAAARVSDMLTEIYAMESAVVRADKMIEAGHRWADLARDFATVYVNESWMKVQANARLLLAELLEGNDLASALQDLSAFDGYIPTSSSRIRARIGAQLIEKGTYPIAQY